jgi:predicted hotdog family 3-hydroxylacyl-ACP dehydratase
MRTPVTTEPTGDLGAWLPHAGPARMLTRVVEVTADAIVCEGTVPPTSPYVSGSSCPTWVGVELAAQAAALLEAHAHQAALAGTRPTGYLVRMRDVRCERPRFAAGTVLQIRVQRLSAALPLFVYVISVSADGIELLRGQISTYLAAEAAPPAAGSSAPPSQTSRKQNH